MDDDFAPIILEDDAQMRADLWRREFIKKMADPNTTKEVKDEMLYSAWALIGNLQYHISLSRVAISDLKRHIPK